MSKESKGRAALLGWCTVVCLTIVLSACGTTPTGSPAAPSALTATTGPTSVVLNWTDNSNDETGFEITRSVVDPSTNVVGAPKQIGTAPANATTFVDGPVEPDVTYRYSVAAVGGHGTSAKAYAATDVTVAAGIDLAVGTFNLTPVFSQTQTSFILYFALPKAQLPTSPVTVTITGPAGWNGGAPLDIQV